MATSWEKPDRQPAATNYNLLRADEVSSRQVTVNGSSYRLFNLAERPERWTILSPPTSYAEVQTGISGGKFAVSGVLSASTGAYGDTLQLDTRYTFSEPLDLGAGLETESIGLILDFQFSWINGFNWAGSSDTDLYYFRLETSPTDYWDIHPFKYQHQEKDPSGGSFPEGEWNRLWYVLPLDEFQTQFGSAPLSVGSPSIHSIASIRFGLHNPYTGVRESEPIGYVERFSGIYVTDPSRNVPGRSAVYLGRGSRYGYAEQTRVLTVGPNGHFNNLRDVYLHLKQLSPAPTPQNPVRVQLMPGYHRWPSQNDVSARTSSQPDNHIGRAWDIDGCKFVGEPGAVILCEPGTEANPYFDSSVELIHLESLMFAPYKDGDWDSAATGNVIPLFTYREDSSSNVRVYLKDCFFHWLRVQIRSPNRGGSEYDLYVDGCTFYWDADDDDGLDSLVDTEGGVGTGLYSRTQTAGQTAQTTDELYSLSMTVTNNAFISRGRGKWDIKNILLELDYTQPAFVNTIGGELGGTERTDFTEDSAVTVRNNFFYVDSGSPLRGGLGAYDGHCIRLFGPPPPGGCVVSGNTTIAVEYSPDQVDVTPCYFHGSGAWIRDTKPQRPAVIKDHNSIILCPNYVGDGEDADGVNVRINHWRTNEVGSWFVFHDCFFWTEIDDDVPLDGNKDTAMWNHYPGNAALQDPTRPNLKSTLVVGPGITGNHRSIAVIASADWGSFAEITSEGEPCIRSISAHPDFPGPWDHWMADGYSNEVTVDDSLSWTLGTVVGKISFETDEGTYYIPLYDSITGS